MPDPIQGPMTEKAQTFWKNVEQLEQKLGKDQALQQVGLRAMVLYIYIKAKGASDAELEVFADKLDKNNAELDKLRSMKSRITDLKADDDGKVKTYFKNAISYDKDGKIKNIWTSSPLPEKIEVTVDGQKVEKYNTDYVGRDVYDVLSASDVSILSTKSGINETAYVRPVLPGDSKYGVNLPQDKDLWLMEVKFDKQAGLSAIDNKIKTIENELRDLDIKSTKIRSDDQLLQEMLVGASSSQARTLRDILGKTV